MDRIFWDKVNTATIEQDQDEAQAQDEEEKKIDNNWNAMKDWLNHFDAQMKGSIVLMCKSAADETRPFAEKYEAREILEGLL